MKIFILLTILVSGVMLLLIQHYPREHIIHMKGSDFKVEVPIDAAILHIDKEVYDHIFSE